VSRGLLVILALATLLLAGCIPSPQDDPTPIAVPAPTTTATDEPAPGGSEEVTLYFLDDGRLHPVQRPVFDTSPGKRLELLLAGPTAAEAAAGVRTAVAPGDVLSSARYSAPDTSVVNATPGFARISGPDQLLALAQVVWTLTEHPGTSQVSVILDGTELEVPTDHGLSKVPVRRSEYTSVAPLEPPDPSPSGPTASPSTTSGRHGPPVPRPAGRSRPAPSRDVRRERRGRPSRMLRRGTRRPAFPPSSNRVDP